MLLSAGPRVNYSALKDALKKTLTWVKERLMSTAKS